MSTKNTNEEQHTTYLDRIRKEQLWPSKKGKISLKTMSVKHLNNCLTMVRNNPKGMYGGFSANSWVLAIEQELNYRQYRNKRIESILMKFMSRSKSKHVS
jgi:hypothetical protein